MTRMKIVNPARRVRRYLACLAFWFFLSGCGHEVSRVPVPKTPLTLVVTEDAKKMYSYRLWKDDKPVSDLRLMGPTGGIAQKNAMTTQVNEGVYRIEWSGTSHHVIIDTRANVVIEDSNRAGSPPVLAL